MNEAFVEEHWAETGGHLMSVKSAHGLRALFSVSPQNMSKQRATLEPRVLLCEDPLKILTITDTNQSSQLNKWKWSLPWCIR